MPNADGGLGTALVGEKIVVNSRSVAVTKLIGEGGFSYVYLVKELSDTALGQSLHSSAHGESTGNARDNKAEKRRAGSASGGKEPDKPLMVLKVTSIHSRSQRDIAEKEAKLLSRLSHPSIIKMFDTCYRQVGGGGGGGFLSKETNTCKPQHIILMEYCEGGHALDVCNKLASAGKRFDLSTLIIAFGQICNAVSYLHAQRPPIVHRDLKPVNFLVKNGAYKLCDFGSAVFGHVDLRTQKARAEAEEVIEKTTTQMFRAPEMVDLYSAKRLTQATDVWALGCCLYSLAFLQNCFEEGSNLAILSRKYKIPEDNPYGDGLVELLDRMLTVDAKARSDMTEVILCLSAVYSGRQLPPRKKPSKPKKEEKESDDARKLGRGERGTGNSEGKDQKSTKKKKEKAPSERVGTFRTDGQGIYDDGLGPSDKKEARKLNPNSAAARRRQAAGGGGMSAQESNHQPCTGTAPDINFTSFPGQFEKSTDSANPDNAFSTASNPFAAVTSEPSEIGAGNSGNDIFGAFDNADSNTSSAENAFANFDTAWGDIAADGTEKAQPAEEFAKFDSTLDEGEDRSPPRRSASGKEKADKKNRKPRRKSGNTGAEGSGSGAGEGLNESFNDINLSNPDNDSRKHRPRGEGEKRHAPKGPGERRRRPKDTGDEERIAPRRNRSGRDASRTTG